MKLLRFAISGLAFLSMLDLRATAQISEIATRRQAREIVRSKLNLRPEQFLDIKRDEDLEQSLVVSANGRANPEFIYKLSLTGYEIKEQTVAHHFSTDADLAYIVAVSPADGSTHRIHGFSDSLSEFEKLMTATNLRVLGPDQAEAVAGFYRAVNPENRSMSPISSMFELKQAAERQCQAIPFDTGDHQFEAWWKTAKPLYAGLQFSQTAIPRDGGYLVEWIVLSSAGSGACGGAPLRARLEVDSDGNIGKLSFLPLRSSNR